MSFTVRPAINSDIPYFYKICLQTGASGSDATSLFKDPFVLGHYFSAPYFFYDKSLCFIAEINSIPMGYLVATDDTQAYRKWLSSEWLPPLRKRYPVIETETMLMSDNEKNIIRLISSDHISQTESDIQRISSYPAHLHIDLLPSLQGKGCGKVLMKILFDELQKRRCPGLHLGVDTLNVSAQGFYKKIGFEQIEKTSWGQYLGIRF